MTARNTQSEGGFAPDRVANVALLNTAVVEDKKGKKYYDYELLSRSGASLFKGARTSSWIRGLRPACVGFEGSKLLPLLLPLLLLLPLPLLLLLLLLLPLGYTACMCGF